MLSCTMGSTLEGGGGGGGGKHNIRKGLYTYCVY